MIAAVVELVVHKAAGAKRPIVEGNLQVSPAVSTLLPSVGPKAAAGGGGAGTRQRAAVNCFDLPVDLCVAIRQGNLISLGFLYPYVLGYMEMVYASLVQMLVAAGNTELCLLAAVNGGLGIVVALDFMFHILPL
jgi:hypothetical protein